MQRPFSQVIKLVALVTAIALLGACGGGGGGESSEVAASGADATGSAGGNSGGEPGTAAASGLTVRLTDAKVNSLEEVWVTFTQVTFQPADGRDRFTHVFDEPVTVELTQLAGGGEVMLLDEYPLEPGDYEWLRLGVLSGEENVDDTYVVEDLSQGGLFFPLKCPSCAKEQSGLKLRWPKDSTWETEGWADFTIDFDVRRSITLAKPNAGPNKKYILKPVLQILETRLASTYIQGIVLDAGLTDPTLREDCVVYVFEGPSPAVTPDDYCSTDFEGSDCAASRDDTALTTANVDLDIDTGDYAYRTMFLYPGTYTVALTCDEDAPDTEENLTFIGETTLLAEAVPEGARRDFRLADIELALDKTLATDNSPYEEGDTIDYRYTVANNSADGADGIVGPVVVRDDKVAVDCEAVDAVGNADDNLDPGESVQCSASYVVTGDDARAGTVTNTAVASLGSSPSNEAVLDVATTTTPVLLVSKSGEIDGEFAAGETISYSLVAENAGNVELTEVELRDALPGLSGLDCTPAQPVATLAMGATLACSASYSITEDDETAGLVSNTATGTSAETGDIDSNTVELGP